MSIIQFNQDLDRFRRWKKRQTQLFNLLEPWLKQQGLFTAEAQQALQQARTVLELDTLTIAVVGEFSRGKTELINALFFGNAGYRLLPTDAGRTTMCPTEIFEDRSAEPCLSLLPIETRLKDTSLQQLRVQPEEWVHIPLDLKKPKHLHQELKRIKDCYPVSIDVAIEMGLHEEGTEKNGTVEIPKWRMAHLNIRHPLLAKGLRVLDTPGLNAVGNEPELTYEILPTTQATLFVLGIDTGVTRSDMTMWEQHIHRPENKQQHGVVIVLNKIDTLWDELRSEEEINDSINAQCAQVAQTLDISEAQVFPASAQKALLARVRKNAELETKSGIRGIEQYLGNQLLDRRQELLIEQSTNPVRAAIDDLSTMVQSRLRRMQYQAEELSSLSNSSTSALQSLVKTTSSRKQQYQQSIDAYKSARSDFKSNGKVLLSTLSIKELDRLIENARKNMDGAWTTFTLKKSMGELFAEINKCMESASKQSQEMRRLVRAIYRRFETRHDFMLGSPKMFSIINHQVELGLVHQESNIFQRSSRTMLTEKHFAVRRYFQTIIRRVREIFQAANTDACDWLETALNPLTREIQEHRVMLAEQLKDLKLAGESRVTVEQRINALHRDRETLSKQLRSLEKVHRKLGTTALETPLKRTKTQPMKKAG